MGPLELTSQVFSYLVDFVNECVGGDDVSFGSLSYIGTQRGRGFQPGPGNVALGHQEGCSSVKAMFVLKIVSGSQT